MIRTRYLHNNTLNKTNTGLTGVFLFNCFVLFLRRTVGRRGVVRLQAPSTATATAKHIHSRTMNAPSAGMASFV